MKHPWLTLGLAGGLYLGASGYRKYRERLHNSEQMAVQTDFKDEHHLRLCDESNLDKRVVLKDYALNMRDLGGYTDSEGRRIKWNKIYRGEELCLLSPEGIEEFKKLGVTHIFDLRDRNKARKHPDPKIEGIEYKNIPVMHGLKPRSVRFGYPNFVDQLMRDLYTAMVVKRGNLFAEVLDLLANDPDAVIYIHCTNGKDRTGIMSALIMLLAGVDEERVLSEYSLSNLTVNKAFKLFDSELVHEVGMMSSRLLYGAIGVDPDWMKIQLDYINGAFGGIDDYLLRNSLLTKYDLASIRENILEPVPEGGDLPEKEEETEESDSSK